MGLRVLSVCLAALLGVAAVAGAAVSPAVREALEKDYEFAHSQNFTDEAVAPLSTIRSSATYNYAVATKMFWLSVTAYCASDDSIQDWSCAPCGHFGDFTVTGVVNDQTNQAYIGYTRNLPASPIDGVSAAGPFAVVAFRGTVPSNLNDWIEDLNASKFGAFDSRYPSVSVHAGFWSAYQAMKPDMLTALKLAISKSGAKTILIAGHSLGGAMAELAAIDLKINIYPSMKYAVYTQGCPRVGNPAFSTLYSSLMDVSFREVHQADLVPHLAPLLLGFRHAPMEIWFNEAFSSYHYCNSTMTGEDPNCSNSVALPVSIADHTNYRGVEMGTYCNSDAETKARLQAIVDSWPEVVEARSSSSVDAEVDYEDSLSTPKIVLTEV